MLLGTAVVCAVLFLYSLCCVEKTIIHLPFRLFLMATLQLFAKYIKYPTIQILLMRCTKNLWVTLLPFCFEKLSSFLQFPTIRKQKRDALTET